MKAASPVLVLLGLLLASCQTAQPPIAADAPSEIFFQRAQAASDQSQYGEAMAIYRNFLSQRPDASHEDTFTARYEIALLEMKLGQDARAQADFEGIVADFGDLDKSSGAPGWVRVLATKKLQELKDKAPKAKA
jgi:hypothetical protein